MDAAGAVRSERYQTVIQPQADAGAGERLHDPAGKEGEQRLLLHLPADRRYSIGALRRPDEEAETGDTPVDQGVAEPTENRVRDEPGVRARDTAFAGHQAFAGDEEVVAGLSVCFACSVRITHGNPGDGVGHGKGVRRLGVGELPGECLHPRVEIGAAAFYCRIQRVHESVVHGAFS